MKVALYWKILLGFWFTFILINQGSWLIYILIWEPRPSYQRSVAERMAPVQLAAARTAIELGGVSGYRRLRNLWPKEYEDVVDIHRPYAAVSGPDFMTVQAMAPDGETWQISFKLPADHRHKREIFYISTELMILGAVGGLLFAAVLAWYLAKPVRRISSGFERLAGGDLSTRLQPEMGRRRDELADLANDFDRMAERLQQLVTVRDQLLHDVSHELRSPLARLAQAIALLRQDPAHAAASCERIETEVRRLDELVGELLSLARAESGESARDSYFDLPELIETVMANASYEAEARNVAVKLRDVSGREGIVRGNAELMRRALENIVRNAVHFTPERGVVEVALVIDRPASQFIVTIADEGPGVPAGKVDAMFDPFVRLDESQERKGYGLGLAIARRAVLALGGSIGARNRTPIGLVVTVTLPIHPFEEPSAQRPEGARPLESRTTS